MTEFMLRVLGAPAFFVMVTRKMHTVIISCIHTEGNDVAVKIFCHMFVIFHIAIDDEQSVVRKNLCECLEGICDLLDAAEEIEMIRVHIQDDTDIWMECVIAVCVFTGLCNEIIGVSHADIAADRIQHTTDACKFPYRD